MKRQKHLIIVFMCILVSMLSVSAEETPQELVHKFYNISYVCENNTCVEGQDIVWEIEFIHRGLRPVEYTSFELLDALNHSPVVDHYIDYFPLMDERGDLLVTEANKNISIRLPGKVPKQNYPNQTLYYPCFTTTIEDIHVFVRHNDYVFRQCYDDNWTLPVVECTIDNHCEEDQVCSAGRCRKLKCDSCEFITGHTCRPYECCSSDQCAFNQVCKNNTCANLECSATQFVSNRTCKNLNCNFDEHIVDGFCSKLTCADTEFVFNHSCKLLECGEKQFIFNHTCRSCAYNQYLDNNTCRPLLCKPNEGFENHECVQLQCSFYQDIVDHECKNNMSIIVKMSAEGIIILIIIALIILDIYRIRKQKQASAGPAINIKDLKENILK